MPGCDFAHMQDDLNWHITHILKGTFLHDATYLIVAFKLVSKL